MRFILRNFHLLHVFSGFVCVCVCVCFFIRFCLVLSFVVLYCIVLCCGALSLLSFIVYSQVHLYSKPNYLLLPFPCFSSFPPSLFTFLSPHDIYSLLITLYVRVSVFDRAGGYCEERSTPLQEVPEISRNIR